jgi:Mg-chelatase subunit ChlD
LALFGAAPATAPAALALAPQQGEQLPRGFVLDAVWSSRIPQTVYPRLTRPVDVAVDGDRIWILDGGVPALARLDARGELEDWQPLALGPDDPVAIDARDGRVAVLWPTRGELRGAEGTRIAAWTHDDAVDVALAPDGRLVVAAAETGPTGGVSLTWREPDGRIRETWRDPSIAVRGPRAVALAPDGRLLLAGDGALYLWRDGGIEGIARATGFEGPDLIDVAIDDQGRALGLLAPSTMPSEPARLLQWRLDLRPTLLATRPLTAVLAIDTGPGPGWLALVDEGADDFAHVGLLRGEDVSAIDSELERWSAPPPAVGALRGPRFVAVGENGDVFFGDDGDRAHHWSAEGEPLAAWPSVGLRDVAAGLDAADGPCVLALDGVRCLAVASAAGAPMRPQLRSDGWPAAISGNRGRLLVADLGWQQATVHGVDGSVTATWPLPQDDGYAAIADVGLAGDTPPLAGLGERGGAGVTWLDANTGAALAMADIAAGADRVSIDTEHVVTLARDGWLWQHDRQGQALAAWRPGPDAAGTPGDVALAPSGHVYVTDPEGERVLRYRPDPGGSLAPPPSDPDACEVHVDKRAAPAVVGLGEPVTVTLEVRGACPRGDGALDVVLALDSSASMTGPPLAAAQRAVAAFLGELDARRARVGLVGFGTTASLLQPLSADLAAVPRAMAGMAASGSTRFAPALAAAQAALEAQSPRPGVPRAVILMSDGRPNDSDRALPAALELQGLGVTLYTVAFGSEAESSLLRRLATPGPHFFEAADGTALIDVFSALGRQVRADRLLDQARIEDRLPPDMAFVPGSGLPPPNRSGDLLRWTLVGVGAEGATLQYQVRPLRAGLRPTNVSASLSYVDFAGTAGRRDFPVPRVEVIGRLFLPWLAKAQCRPRRVDVALVFDTSRSMEQPADAGGERKLDAARAAARGFLDAMRFPGDRAAIVAFDADARLLQGLTADPSAALAGLDALATQPGTRIDAGLTIGRAALADPNRSRAVAPVLVLLTDGRPTPGTRQAAVDAAAAARAAGITVFAIGLGSDVDAGLLVELAGDLGRAFLAPDAGTLRAVYDALAGEVLCE